MTIHLSADLVDTEAPHHFESDLHALCVGALHVALQLAETFVDIKPTLVLDDENNGTRRFVIEFPETPMSGRWLITFDPIDNAYGGIPGSRPT